MSQTVSNLADVMKEVFTSDRLEKQFYDENPFLGRLEKTSKFTIGKKAVVPIHKGRSGGVSVRSSAGGALNAADEQKVDRAEFTVPYNYHQIEVEIAAFNEAAGGGFSVGTAMDLEISGGLADLRNNVTRQVLSNGDAIIATCGTTSASTEVELGAYGYDAIVRGWLYEGMPVDIGTAADEDADVAGSVITAVEESASTPSITIGSSVTTTSSDFVSLADSRSGTTSHESTGLRTVFGSTTSAVGGLDPDTAGESFWKPATVETDTAISLGLLLRLRRATHQRTGKASNYVLTSLKQLANLEEILQTQVRFSSDGAKAAGTEGVTWNGMEIEAIPDVPDRELYMIDLASLHLVTGAKIKKPTWVSDLAGNNQGMIWKQGNTSFVDALVYPVGLAVTRRNSGAAAISLTA